MARRRRLALVPLLLALGCSSSSLTSEYCNRLDACNRLRGSVEECVADLDTSLDDLSPHDRDELEYEVQDCLDHPSCGGFTACVSALTGD